MSSGIATEAIVDGVFLKMCCYCFHSVEKEQLTSVHGEPGITKIDICINCTAKEHLAMHRFWSI